MNGQRPAPSGRFPPRERAYDPRAVPANENGPGPNVPPVSVGPTSSDGYGNTHVMYPEWDPPVQADAWSGWPVGWATPPMGPGWEQWSGYGYGRQNDMWGRVSTTMTCVDLNSRELGSFPVYGVKAKAPVPLPQWSNNPEPEVYSSWPEFVMSAVNALLLRGECVTYATGRYNDGSVARFITLSPDLVDIEFIDGHRVVSLGETELDPDDVCVVKYQSWPGRVRGISPLEWLAGPIATSGALERYAAGLANRGGIPWATITHPANLTAEQSGHLQASWVAASQRRDGAPAVLSGGIELQTVTLSPVDMALLELREFDERRICAAFGVPAYLVNVAMASGLTYVNAEALFRHHWTATLRPLANLLAQAWSSWLLPRGTSLEFNPDRYVQEPFGERAQAWATLHNIFDPSTGERAITIPEVRVAERFTPLDGTAMPDVAAEILTGASL